MKYPFFSGKTRRIPSIWVRNLLKLKNTHILLENLGGISEKVFLYPNDKTVHFISLQKEYGVQGCSNFWK